jgi:two-component system cell cycle response regulator
VTRAHAAVLVVDDDPVNRTLLSRSLEREGYRVSRAENGREALEQLHAEPFDIVLLDVLMPELDGYETLERIESDEKLRNIPVIMVSALGDLESVVRCIELGAEDYIPKPCNPVLLRARMNACLTKKRLRDLELEYIEHVGHVAAAAAAVEASSFDPAVLEDVALRDDALGQLARVFRRMAKEVQTREQRLREQVEQLRIEIDDARAARQVVEITETDYFRDLETKVDELRLRDER